MILDPAVTVHTPQWLWLSTGIRAVDHAVEDLCSINPKPLSDGTSFHALRLLGRGLRAVKADPSNLEARLDCQLGAWMSVIGSNAGVHKGASHGIGHVLAALIAGLGLPRTLREVNVMPELLERIAAESMHDRWIHTNPRRIEGPAVVRQLLDAAW